jgi:hypothetical protein
MGAIDHQVIEDAISSADHKAIILQGMMKSERGRQKTAIIVGLINSLAEDLSDLVCEVMEARRKEDECPCPTCTMHDELAMTVA